MPLLIATMPLLQPSIDGGVEELGGEDNFDDDDDDEAMLLLLLSTSVWSESADWLRPPPRPASTMASKWLTRSLLGVRSGVAVNAAEPFCGANGPRLHGLEDATDEYDMVNQRPFTEM